MTTYPTASCSLKRATGPLAATEPLAKVATKEELGPKAPTKVSDLSWSGAAGYFSGSLHAPDSFFQRYFTGICCLAITDHDAVFGNIFIRGLCFNDDFISAWFGIGYFV
jgi:hypothetical protein